MRCAHSLPIALLAATLAGAAAAQTPAPAVRQDLRQLSWAGRNTTAAPATPTPTRTDMRRPNLVIPHGGFSAVEPASGSRAAPAPAPRRTLTPASAWLQPTAAPAAPVAAPAPTPAPRPAPVPAYVDAPGPARTAPPPPRPAATPDYLPPRSGRGQPVPADIAYASPAPAPPEVTAPSPADPADPMAPRRDAPIFRLQRNAPAPTPEAAEAPGAETEAEAEADAPSPRRIAEVTNTGERPAQYGARYYSVHRQNGRQPDALSIPEPTFVDALAITMTATPASQDLAQPDQGPTLIRDNQGRIRPAPAASDGDHQ